MLKRLFASISFLVYFTVTCGVVVNMHYCMNRFDSVQLYTSKAEVCGKCGMHTDDSNGCCHDELKVVKLKTDHNASHLNFVLKSPDVLSASTISLSDLSRAGQFQKNICTGHSPPLFSAQDIYLHNCVFRI